MRQSVMRTWPRAILSMRREEGVGEELVLEVPGGFDHAAVFVEGAGGEGDDGDDLVEAGGGLEGGSGVGGVGVGGVEVGEDVGEEGL